MKRLLICTMILSCAGILAQEKAPAEKPVPFLTKPTSQSQQHQVTIYPSFSPDELKKQLKRYKEWIDKQLDTIDPLFRTTAGFVALSTCIYAFSETEQKNIGDTFHHLFKTCSSGFYTVLYAVPFVASAYILYKGLAGMNQPHQSSMDDDEQDQQSADLVSVDLSKKTNKAP